VQESGKSFLQGFQLPVFGLLKRLICETSGLPQSSDSDVWLLASSCHHRQASLQDRSSVRCFITLINNSPSLWIRAWKTAVCIRTSWANSDRVALTLPRSDNLPSRRRLYYLGPSDYSKAFFTSLPLNSDTHVGVSQ